MPDKRDEKNPQDDREENVKQPSDLGGGKGAGAIDNPELDENPKNAPREKNIDISKE